MVQASRQAIGSLPEPEVILACLARVEASPPFARSRRLREFLAFAVRAVLEGRADQIKERTIAVEVYGRSLDYDPRSDPIVRSEAHRLRARLATYYAGEGRADPIVIDLPKGGYRPAFRVAGAGVRGTGRRAAALRVEDRASADEERFALALRRAVSSRLAGTPGLRLVYRRRAAGRTPGAEEAEYAATGAFERSGGRCRLEVRVVRVADGEQVWSGSYRFPRTRVAQVRDEVAERVCASVTRRHSHGTVRFREGGR